MTYLIQIEIQYYIEGPFFKSMNQNQKTLLITGGKFFLHLHLWIYLKNDWIIAVILRFYF